MPTKKAMQARIDYLEGIISRLPKFASCSTLPGLCPHTRKVTDLDGGHYWICKDEELPWQTAEQIKQREEQGDDGDNCRDGELPE